MPDHEKLYRKKMCGAADAIEKITRLLKTEPYLKSKFNKFISELDTIELNVFSHALDVIIDCENRCYYDNGSKFELPKYLAEMLE